MKLKICTGIISILTFLTVNAQDIDVLHYRFSIDVFDQHDTIYGKAELKVKFLKESGGPEFDLVLLKPDGKGMMLIKAESNHLRTVQELPEKEKIKFHLTRLYKAGDTASFTIYYKGVPADGLIISKTRYGRRSFFADNWPNRGHNWLPSNDQPSDKAGVEFIVTAPEHYQVIANGIQVEETNLSNGRRLTHWIENTPISTKVMVIGVAEFAVQLSGMINNNIPVYSWIYPEDRAKGFYDYSMANEVLNFYIKKIGPYPYNKLANVQSKTTFGGLENANTIFYAENSVTGTGKSEGLIAHEVAHQWFGNHATEKTFAHLWLSEGFATYMTIVYMENKYGKDTALKMLLEDRKQVSDFAKTSNATVVDNNPDFMQLLNANSYQKGSWVLHMLRRNLGDSVFFRSLRRYYYLYGGKTAATEDLQAVFEEISGKDLKQFFSQWLYEPGIPRIALKWDYNSLQKKLIITIIQQQPGKAFLFPMELLITERNNKSRIEKVNIVTKSQVISLPMSQKPASISLDPNLSLLFEQVF
jgi:aminopeptidase N